MRGLERMGLMYGASITIHEHGRQTACMVSRGDLEEEDTGREASTRAKPSSHPRDLTMV